MARARVKGGGMLQGREVRRVRRVRVRVVVGRVGFLGGRGGVGVEVEVETEFGYTFVFVFMGWELESVGRISSSDSSSHLRWGMSSVVACVIALMDMSPSWLLRSDCSGSSSESS